MAAYSVASQMAWLFETKGPLVTTNPTVVNAGIIDAPKVFSWALAKDEGLLPMA